MHSTLACMISLHFGSGTSHEIGAMGSAGITPDSPLLEEFKTYAEFPRSEEWIESSKA